MRNTLLFTYGTNILVRLLTVNMKSELSYPKNQKMCDLIIVNLVVKMRFHPAAHLHQPLIRKYPRIQSDENQEAENTPSQNEH